MILLLNRLLLLNGNNHKKYYMGNNKNKFKSKYQIIEYQEEKDLLIQQWKSETEYMTDEVFMHEMSVLAEYITKYKPSKILVDQRDFFFTVTPTLQEWVNENVNAKISQIGSFVAFVVSKDLFASVSVEQTLSESHGKSLIIKFFQDKEEALKWLDEVV